MEYQDLSAALFNRCLQGYEHSGSRDSILVALEAIAFPASKRSNVRRAGEGGEVLGMCLGMTECWYKGPMPSRHTRERPNLCRLLCAFARRELPGFHFTSIQVNKDYAAELHVDKKDAGDSRIIGLGPYLGGQLWVDDGSNGGKGRVANIKEKWLGFDGNLPHKVLPFQGRRYTLVFFSKLRGWSVGLTPDSKHAKVLLDLGFPLPVKQPNVKSLMHSSDLLVRARRRYELFSSHTLSRGGAGRPLRVLLKGLAPESSSSHPTVVAEMSTASPIQALKLALKVSEVPESLSNDHSEPEAVQVRLASLPLLPSDCFGRLGVSGRPSRKVALVDCTYPAKRQRIMA